MNAVVTLNMRTLIFSILIVIVIILSSCGDTPCAKGDLRFGLIGFSNAESDTLIMRRFPKNSLIIKDSFVFNDLNPIRFVRFGDTLTIGASTSEVLMLSDYDYQLFFPGAGKSFRITDIKEQQSYTKSGLFNTSKVGCINPISSCKADGVDISTFTFPNTIYLKK